MPRHWAALRHACLDAIHQSDGTRTGGWDAVESTALTVFESCPTRRSAAGGGAGGDEELGWKAASAALLWCQPLLLQEHEEALATMRCVVDKRTPIWREVHHKALCFACFHGHFLFAAQLLKADAPSNSNEEINAADWWSMPMLLAAQNGHQQCISALLEEGADVDAANEQGETALIRAAKQGHEVCVVELISAGADVDSADEDGWTPLMRAAQHGHEKCVAVLIGAGSDVDAVVEGEWCTPLMMAVQNGFVCCARALLEAKADVDATKEDDDYCALMFACERGHHQCVRLLMSYMAYHPFATHPECIETLFLTSEEMRQWVGEAAKWSSPLHFVDVNSPARTTFLLRDGADIHARLGSGLPTPLDVALAKGGDSSSLILRASKPWSVGTHSLFPSQARRRAYDLLKIGLLFAASRQKHAFFDVWQFLVMPHAIVRDEEATTTTP